MTNLLYYFQKFAVTKDNERVDISPLPGLNPGDQAKYAWENGLNIALGIAAAVALLMIVINGFQYITASGDPQRTAHARQGIIYSAVGLLVVAVAAAIVTFVVRGVAS